MKVLFAHGFEGVPGGSKTRALIEAGYAVDAPFMPSRGWTFEDQVAVVLDAVDGDPELTTLVGSSLGAFAVAVAASHRPTRALSLLLLAPAVGVHLSWARQLGDEGLELWAEMGTLLYRHLGVGENVELPYALYTESRDHSGLVVRHPAIIVHGVDDDTILVDRAIELTRRSPGVRRLYVVPDGHRLAQSHEVMIEALELLRRWGPAPALVNARPQGAAEAE